MRESGDRRYRPVGRLLVARLRRQARIQGCAIVTLRNEDAVQGPSLTDCSRATLPKVGPFDSARARLDPHRAGARHCIAQLWPPLRGRSPSRTTARRSEAATGSYGGRWPRSVAGRCVVASLSSMAPLSRGAPCGGAGEPERLASSRVGPDRSALTCDLRRA
jgi:hypothetical protein